QALMEFGALVCKPQRPNCGDCFLQDSCVALADNLIASLPRKDKKTKVRHRFFNYLVVTTPNNKTRIEKRTQGIWKNLYQFPLIEGPELLSYEQLIEDELFATIFGMQPFSIKLFNQVPIVHKLTHQHIHTQFWLVAAEDSKSFETSWDTLGQFPVPRLIDNFLNLHKINQKISTFG
ncbi:MAG: NUDIX domain-containing protein, partial [Lutibacter sp.]|nr:NUDIX domain-containing protein [Lutibacter sp.]